MISEEQFEQLDPKKHIIIKGAKVNNLKNLSVAIPRNKLVVVTGVSGSGKSSLAFDTLYAEGQRMYVESLSSYARQFLGRMEKPEVDYIKGISPAIAIEQKVATRNPRSTVGTTTEIYDYLKLLFARVGKTISPISGAEVTKDTVSAVVDFVTLQAVDTKLMILTPLILHEERSLLEELELLLKKGFSRVTVNGDMQFIEDVLKSKLDPDSDINILIDRLARKDDEDVFRLSDSIQTAFFEGQGTCIIDVVGGEKTTFSDKFELDEMVFEEPSVNFFSFNNPFGACRTCEGFGHVLGIDPDLVIPDKKMSVYEGAIAPWKGEKMSEWLAPLIANGIHFDFPIHRSFEELSAEEKSLLWTGNKYFQGLNDFFIFLQEQTHKIQYRVLLSRYRGRTVCPDCQGTRLRKDASYVKVSGKSVQEIVLMQVSDAIEFFSTIELDPYKKKVADRLLIEIKNRLGFMDEVGLGYLTLNRLTSTLSGGEYQRIKLATSLGSALVGSMYVLDEPSIGLHPRDTERLIEVLYKLRDAGNTVIVVEHEEEVMRAADQIIDIGPHAGSHGGELIFQGTLDEITKDTPSHTARYLFGIEGIEVPKFRRNWHSSIKILGASENNLKNIDVEIPLNILTVITGVSGSGKSTLVKKILYPSIKKIFGEFGEFTGKFKKIEGDINEIKSIEFIDQNPIGKSSRSNPVTYVKAYDTIRAVYSVQEIAKQRSYKPSQFSFNVEGGRCEECQGEGVVKIEMQFMADLFLTCESCGGKRFKSETLDVLYNGKNIAELLDLTIDDAIEFFKQEPKIITKLQPLQDVGLGYVKLGQSSNSLSGGEAQRVKLAFFLSKGVKTDPTLFIFDEPTTGLHFHDINKLLTAFNALIEAGHSVVVIEHNNEIMKSADWIIDLGPEGGDKGGEICFVGTPEELAKVEGNYTAKSLKGKV